MPVKTLFSQPIINKLTLIHNSKGKAKPKVSQEVSKENKLLFSTPARRESKKIKPNVYNESC